MLHSSGEDGAGAEALLFLLCETAGSGELLWRVDLSGLSSELHLRAGCGRLCGGAQGPRVRNSGLLPTK